MGMETIIKKSRYTLDLPFTLLSAAMLFYFALPKITYNEISLKGFADFSPKLGLAPEGFMLFTGYMELSIMAALIMGIILLLKGKAWLLWLANGLLLGTMLTGLYIEFFARTHTAYMLAGIAILFSIIAGLQLIRHIRSVKALLSN
jgi:branched-subunit amino acid transport protein